MWKYVLEKEPDFVEINIADFPWSCFSLAIILHSAAVKVHSVSNRSIPVKQLDFSMMLSNYLAAGVGMSFAYLYNYFFTYGFVHFDIDKGILRGRNASTWKGQSYFSFKGIPYAKPPIDEFRFKAPREEASWIGVRDATSHGAVCPHVDMAFGILRGDEDCLFLNVYTTTLGDGRLPVMVWIHGGMFLLGSGNDEMFGPDYFVEAGVVLVTVNYRLGALGFLSTGDDGAPGNAGLKDQVAALRWIRRNIARFGGDPDNVTIFGGSSGAACAHFHLLSPMSSGLFAKAIAQSGSAVNDWAVSENGPEIAVRLAVALGAENVAGNTARALEFLKTASYGDIVWAQPTLLTEEEKRMRVSFLFTPTLEKGVESEEVFLSDRPSEILKSGKFNQVPIIIGYTSQEGYFFMNELERPEVMKMAIDDTVRYIPKDIKEEQVRNDLAESIRKFYFDGKPVALENISNFVDLYSDTVINAGVKRATKLHVASNESSVFFYVFSHDGTMNLLKFFFDIDRPGAVHGDELGYMFHQRMLFWRTPLNGSSNERVLYTMVRLWTNFAKFGDPTPPGDPLTWKPVTLEKFHFLNITGEETLLAENPDPERAKFWAEAYEKEAAL